MAYATTVFPAKVALKALLDGWTWTGGTPTITWGQPTELEDETYDMVYLGPTRVPENTYTTLGATRTDETYTISVFVDVRQWGDDEQAAEQQAWARLNQIASLLAQNHTLSGTVNRITGWAFEQVNPIPAPQKWRSQIKVDIAVVGLVFP